jgi:hypothetical protein
MSEIYQRDYKYYKENFTLWIKFVVIDTKSQHTPKKNDTKKEGISAPFSTKKLLWNKPKQLSPQDQAFFLAYSHVHLPLPSY